MSQVTNDPAAQRLISPASQPQCLGPCRFLEIVRRLVLAGGVLAAVWMLLMPADHLIRVQSVDFAKRQKQKSERMKHDLRMMERESGAKIDPSMNETAGMSLQEYVAKETTGRTIQREGKTWEKFYNSVSSTLSGSSTELVSGLAHGTASYYLYFLPDQPPLNELAGKIGDENKFTYVSVPIDGQTKYLDVLFERPANFVHYAPTSVAYPWRHLAVWAFIVAMLLYAFLPRHRRAADELGYSRARAEVLPDMLGAAMMAAFFALPILILTENAARSSPVRLPDFEDGWGIITAVLWAFAAGGLSILITALWYSTLSIFVLGDRIRRRTLFSDREIAYSQIVAVEPATRAMPKWLRALAIFLALFNWRMLGPVLLGTSQRAYGIKITCKDGKSMKLWTSNLPGYERIFRAMFQAGVPLDEELKQAVQEDLAETPAQPTPTGTGKGQRITAYLLLALVIGGALFLQFRPQAAQKVEHRLEFTYDALAQRSKILKQMEQVHQQMQQTSNTEAQEKLFKQYEELEKQYDTIVPTEER